RKKEAKKEKYYSSNVFSVLRILIISKSKGWSFPFAWRSVLHYVRVYSNVTLQKCNAFRSLSHLTI
ncbi:hypothetical protein, partial [Arcicella rosea]|uniref:hypothetical protein n=1 Tax=Arcicella rosea TaxID=502909 RepID=UPI00345C726B